jgi:DNA-binding winged helix-turn-helix (wHTH) protein
MSTLDCTTRVFRLPDGQSIQLTKNENTLLKTLALSGLSGSSNQTLQSTIWGNLIMGDNGLSALIWKTRDKLKAIGQSDLIENMFGFGFRLRHTVKVVDEKQEVIVFRGDQIATLKHLIENSASDEAQKMKEIILNQVECW